MIFYRFLAWIVMTACCFIALTAVMAILPLLGSFIIWDLIKINWPFLFMMSRMFFVFSVFIGIMFAFSSDGRGFAVDLQEMEREWRMKKNADNEEKG